jgi:hypothetical protein
LILDHKGKTGCIDVIFNGIDSNNLRLGSYFNKDTFNQKNSTTSANTSNLNTNPLNNETTPPSNSNNNNNMTSSSMQASSSPPQAIATNYVSNSQSEQGAVGGEAASAVAPAAGFIPISSNENASNSNTPVTTSNLNSIQELSLGLPQG